MTRSQVHPKEYDVLDELVKSVPEIEHLGSVGRTRGAPEIQHDGLALGEARVGNKSGAGLLDAQRMC